MESPSPPRRSRHRLAHTGLLVAVMAASLPTKSIPASLIGLLLPPVEAGLAIAGYLALGCLGLPVFPGFRSGAGMFFGPDGGYLVAPLFQAVATSLLFRARPGTEWNRLVPPLLAGQLVHIGLGTAGTIWLGGYPPRAALVAAATMLPWIGFKVWVAGALFRRVRPSLAPFLDGQTVKLTSRVDST